MSFIKQQTGLFALIYTNTAEFVKESGIYAVVRLCFGNEADSINIPYVKLDVERRGFQMPAAVVVSNGQIFKMPLITGMLWLDLVDLAERAMQRVKEQYPVVPMGTVFKVYRDGENKSIVEQQPT